jgi:hypothetical protein
MPRSADGPHFLRAIPALLKADPRTPPVGVEAFDAAELLDGLHAFRQRGAVEAVMGRRLKVPRGVLIQPAFFSPIYFCLHEPMTESFIPIVNSMSATGERFL